MTFKVLIKTDNREMIPVRSHPTDAGLDLMSIHDYDLQPGSQQLLDTGVAYQIPPGYAGFVFNRSSQGKIGVQIANGTGIIDADYRGNIKVLLKNTGDKVYSVLARETRIAQLIIMPVMLAELVEYTDSDENWVNTKRGTGGFGSTGT